MKTAGDPCAKNERVACRAKAKTRRHVTKKSGMCTTRLIEHLVNETRALGLVRENVRREPNLVLACEAHSKAQLLLSRLGCASLAGALPCDAALALHSILSTVGGFLVGALRDESSSPAELRPAALWNTTSGGVSDETIQALSLPTDHEAVFTTTLDAVVAIHIPA